MFYLVIIKSDSQAIFKHDTESSAMSAFHTECASDQLYFADGTITSYTVMVVNQSGDAIAKEFRFKQD